MMNVDWEENEQSPLKYLGLVKTLQGSQKGFEIIREADTSE